MLKLSMHSSKQERVKLKVAQVVARASAKADRDIIVAKAVSLRHDQDAIITTTKKEMQDVVDQV